MEPEDKRDFEAEQERWRRMRCSVEDNSFDGGRFMAGVLAGAVIGVGAALLLAPQSGEDSRDDIRGAGAMVRDRTVETFDEARGAVEDWIAQTKQTIEDTRQRLDEAVDAGRAAADKKRAELDARVDASLDA
jgi:gas vesicle protein